MYDCINKAVKIAMVKLCRQSFFTRNSYDSWGETFCGTLTLPKRSQLRCGVTNLRALAVTLRQLRNEYYSNHNTAL
jgi:hypothetical protein